MQFPRRAAGERRKLLRSHGRRRTEGQRLRHHDGRHDRRPGASSTLDVQIKGPTQATVGSKVTFEITVTNRGQSPAKQLVIKDRFDAGLEPPDVPDVTAKRTIDGDLGDLAPGASRTITIKFQVTRPGRLCHTAEVSGPDTPAGTAEACLTATGGGEPSTGPTGEKPALTVKKTGPSQRTVGETARFLIDVTNSGTTALRGVRVVDSYDAALPPAQATEGYRAESGGLVWTIDELPAGKAVQFEVHCKCQAASASACNRVSVTAQDGAKAQDEACVEILASGGTGPTTGPPPAGDLTMTMPGLHNPITVGKGVLYTIQVTNNSTQTYRQVAVTATVPTGMMPAQPRHPRARRYAVPHRPTDRRRVFRSGVRGEAR